MWMPWKVWTVLLVPFQKRIRSKLATFIVVNSKAKANNPLLRSCYQLSALCHLGVFRHLGRICLWLCFNLVKTWVSYPNFLTCQEFIQPGRWLVGNRESAPTFAVCCTNKAAQRSKILQGFKMSRAPRISRQRQAENRTVCVRLCIRVRRTLTLTQRWWRHAFKRPKL